jgi:hypothetical protein
MNEPVPRTNGISDLGPEGAAIHICRIHQVIVEYDLLSYVNMVKYYS